MDHLVAAGRQLMIVLAAVATTRIRSITEGSGALDVGFDADDAPSHFAFPLE
jgi:hypothetical protein